MLMPGVDVTIVCLYSRPNLTVLRAQKFDF